VPMDTSHTLEKNISTGKTTYVNISESTSIGIPIQHNPFPYYDTIIKLFTGQGGVMEGVVT